MMTPPGRRSMYHYHTTARVMKDNDGDDESRDEEDMLCRTVSQPKPHVSMTESDKPDMMDLVS